METNLNNYREEYQSILSDGVVISECNAITFLNVGATNIILNNSLTLAPGDQYVSEYNEGEMNRTRYNLILNGGAALVIRKTLI